MRNRINHALADLKKRFEKGELIWNFENIQREIIAYPKHGRNDKGEPEGMEDEAVESVVAEDDKL